MNWKHFVALSLFTTCSAFAEDKMNLEFAKPDGHSLQLDLFLPAEAAEPPPVVVWIHGGGFKGGNRKAPPIRWMREEGFAVASISYRLTDKAIFPAQIHDAKAAIRWLRAHAEELGINADRIGTAGHSAGGMLSALLGTSGNVNELEGNVGENLEFSSAVQAVVETSGGTDYPLFHKTKPNFGNLAKLLGGPVDEKMELAKLASPVTHVDQTDPPMLIMQGSKDSLIPPNQAESLYRHCVEANAKATLNLVEGAGHDPKTFYSGENRAMMLEFFREHLLDD